LSIEVQNNEKKFGEEKKFCGARANANGNLARDSERKS
jgi:hypothetical protein